MVGVLTRSRVAEKKKKELETYHLASSTVLEDKIDVLKNEFSIITLSLQSGSLTINCLIPTPYLLPSDALVEVDSG